MARGKLERTPLVPVVVTVVFFAWLYLPILAVALFSLNDTKSLASFTGFSLRWYDALIHDSALIDSLWASIQIATVATLASLVLGTMLALGLERVLLCCAPDNIGSRRAILANGGEPDGHRHGEDRFWIDLTDRT